MRNFWINIPGGQFSCRISEPSTACEHVVSFLRFCTAVCSEQSKTHRLNWIRTDVWCVSDAEI